MWNDNVSFGLLSYVPRNIGESHLLLGGFLIWGGALFHTRRSCAVLNDVNH
jgi:hypothetical protein